MLLYNVEPSITTNMVETEAHIALTKHEVLLIHPLYIDVFTPAAAQVMGEWKEYARWVKAVSGSHVLNCPLRL